MHKVLAFLLAACPALATAVEVRGTDLQPRAGGSHVVLELSDPVAYRVFRMGDPERVVIDLREARATRTLSLPADTSGLVTGLRQARRGEGDLRVVLDLSRAADAVPALLAPDGTGGHRLVVDLTERPARPASPEATGVPGQPVRGDRQPVPLRAAPMLAQAPATAPQAAAADRRLEQRLAELERARAAHEEATRRLLAQTERLERRLRELEAGTVAAEDGDAARRLLARNEHLERRVQELETGQAAAEDGEAARRLLAQNEQLERRVEELEVSRAAAEDATRAIIRDSVSTLGPQINEAVALTGSLELSAAARQDFAGKVEKDVEISTAELGFEVQVNPWTTGQLLVEYDRGSSVFTSTQGDETSVDRINLKTAKITVGDTTRFPFFAVAGRQTLPFGTALGSSVADPLTIDDPITIEVFELRENAVGVGVAFPTPEAKPTAPPVVPKPVKPQLLNPAISALGEALGYRPPSVRPPPATPVPLPVPPPMFNVAAYTFKGNTRVANTRGFSIDDHFGATAGVHLQGDCGRRYEDIDAEGRWWPFGTRCPWAVDVDVDYNNSVYDSLFLESEYRPFLEQIGFVPGVAASLKAAMGSMALVAEWNGAIEDATFVDGVNRFIRMRPSSWMVGLGYQLDWNPWVQRIGEQGTYLTVGYSESSDLAGVIRPFTGERTGNVPKRRLIFGIGEWVLDGVKFAVEYSRNFDYSIKHGGTGRHADAIVSQFTYVW